MKVFVYVDGFNLYYRALKNTQYKWLNLDTVSQRLVKSADTIEKVRYFTARVSARAGDPDAPRRQQIYLNALGTLPNITFHYGRFLPKKKWRPLVSDPTKYVEIHDTEEKGSDVNLAVHLLHDGWLGNYEMALILSQDTDLIEPLRLVRDELTWISQTRLVFGLSGPSAAVFGSWDGFARGCWNAVICGSRNTSRVVVSLPRCESVRTRVSAQRNGVGGLAPRSVQAELKARWR